MKGATIYCCQCGEECTVSVHDFGIGPYEYWGDKGTQHDYEAVTDCCESSTISEGICSGCDGSEGTDCDQCIRTEGRILCGCSEASLYITDNRPEPDCEPYYDC